MIVSYNRRSLAFGISGLILQTGGWIALIVLAGKSGGESHPALIWSLIAMFAGTLLLLCGLGWYAKAKGRSSLWGVLGFIGLPGLLILGLLSDKTRDTSASSARPAADNLIARISVYLGVIGILPVLGLLSGVAGVVCGIVGLRRSRERGGRCMAIAGIILSGFFLLLWTALIVAVVVSEGIG